MPANKPSPLLKHPTVTRPPDPDDEPMVCEVCGEPVRKGDTFSFSLSWGTTGPVPIAAFHCGGGHYGHGQHFTCSRECAVAAAKACVEEHLLPMHEDRYRAHADNPRLTDEQKAHVERHRHRYEVRGRVPAAD